MWCFLGDGQAERISKKPIHIVVMLRGNGHTFWNELFIPKFGQCSQDLGYLERYQSLKIQKIPLISL